MNVRAINICQDCGAAGVNPPAQEGDKIVYFSETLRIWICTDCGDKYFGV